MSELSVATAPPVRHPGLVCRQCGCRHFLTVYTRPRGETIVRRKRCRNCGCHILTRERIA